MIENDDALRLTLGLATDTASLLSQQQESSQFSIYISAIGAV